MLLSLSSSPSVIYLLYYSFNYPMNLDSPHYALLLSSTFHSFNSQVEGKNQLQGSNTSTLCHLLVITATHADSSPKAAANFGTLLGATTPSHSNSLDCNSSLKTHLQRLHQHYDVAPHQSPHRATLRATHRVEGLLPPVGNTSPALKERTLLVQETRLTWFSKPRWDSPNSKGSSGTRTTSTDSSTTFSTFAPHSASTTNSRCSTLKSELGDSTSSSIVHSQAMNPQNSSEPNSISLPASRKADDSRSPSSKVSSNTVATLAARPATARPQAFVWLTHLTPSLTLKFNDSAKRMMSFATLKPGRSAFLS